MITRKLVPENQRLAITEKRFGLFFPLAIEPTIYTISDRLAKAYGGGYWEFYTLSNGGFYMAPQSELSFYVCCDNGFGGEMSPDALGVTVCLYAYSQLSFSQKLALAEVCAEHYHWLRGYALEHEEVDGIMRAID